MFTPVSVAIASIRTQRSHFRSSHVISPLVEHPPVKRWPPAAALRCPKAYSRTSPMRSCAKSRNTIPGAPLWTSFPQTRDNPSLPIPLSRPANARCARSRRGFLVRPVNESATAVLDHFRKRSQIAHDHGSLARIGFDDDHAKGFVRD